MLERRKRNLHEKKQRNPQLKDPRFKERENARSISAGDWGEKKHRRGGWNFAFREIYFRGTSKKLARKGPEIE